jgi:glutaredoxin-dependent peroxiredoxin
MSLNVGDNAPDFVLKDQDANDVSLNDFKGKKVVILFFPFAYSSVCTKEMCLMRDGVKNYENINAQIIGISVDSHYSLKAWAMDNDLNFPLLSDFNKEVSKKYDSLEEVFAPGKYNYKGVSKRSAFVVDENGEIIYKEICEHPGLQPTYSEIEKIVKG